MLTAYLPRFLVAVLAVPLVYVGIAFTAARLADQPQTAAAVAGAVAFSAVVLAPSTKNAAVRAGLLVAAAAVAAAISFAVAR